MIAVTCFSQNGYHQTGRKSLESFARHWPCKIIAYHEGPEPDFKHTLVEYRKFEDIPNVTQFLHNIQSIKSADGIFTINGKKTYDYNYDLFKFCRKIFAQYDVLDEHKGKVFWVDNDVITEKKVTEKFLNGLFDSHLVFLGRKRYYTETGFIGFDTLHGKFPTFLSRYKDCLKKGIVFSLKRWHDCEVFDWARMGDGTDLSPFWEITDDINVWPRTVLSEYMTHYKGSKKSDLSVNKLNFD